MSVLKIMEQWMTCPGTLSKRLAILLLALSGVLFASAFVMFKKMDKYFADVI